MDTLTALPERCVGEIWIHGPSVTMGYWGRKQLSDDMFGAQLTEPASDKKVKHPLSSLVGICSLCDSS